MEETVEQRVVACVSEVFLGDVKVEATLAGDLEFDALDLYDILVYVEDEFDLSIPDEDAEKWQTVRDVVAYVEQRLAGKGE